MTEKQLAVVRQIRDLEHQGFLTAYEANWIVSAIDLLNQEPLSTSTRHSVRDAVNAMLDRAYKNQLAQ